MQKKAIEIFDPASLAAWRKWLAENHLSKQAVWLVFYNKGSRKKTITWRDAVTVALCFGWIDSKRIKMDKETAHQFFSKRKPNSTWSKINKENVQRLIDEELMTDAGFKAIETAKQNGSWTILDDVEKLMIPRDLESELKTKPFALDYFQNLSKSIRKAMLQWIVLARRAETRQKRITEIVERAANKQKPRHIQ